MSASIAQPSTQSAAPDSNARLEQAIAASTPTKDSILLELTMQTRMPVAQALRDGALSDDDILAFHANPEMATEFATAWRDASVAVNEAKQRRDALAKQHQDLRIDRGQYQVHQVDAALIDENGHVDMTPYFEKQHPDECVGTRLQGHTVHQVRISPGEVAELDEATYTWRVAERLRRDAIHRLMQRHR